MSYPNESGQMGPMKIAVLQPPGGGRLAALSADLQAQGIDPGQLDELQDELDAVQSPPGAITRLRARLQQRALLQWGHVVGELQESAEAMSLLRKGIAQRQLSAEERDTVRAQMLDLVKVVPAGLIAMANSALPVPGTSLFTPWLLARLGLMPSRWREAHLLTELEREQERLQQAGHQQAAAQLAALHDQLEDEADQRERAARDAMLLTQWDANRNGVWDAEEKAAYQRAVEAMRRRRDTAAARRRWYLSLEGQIFGPVRLTELAREPGTALLICYDGRSGWVSLDDLLGEGAPRAW